MATLALSAVGALVGGPIGAIVGAFVGQKVDQKLFGPKAIEGPRLGDLAIQTSSYGTPLPQLFGRTRVSGTVIWATDLREERNTSGGGKSRPKQVSYSYAANFAVALSARRAGRIGRIWADGKLLRGEAGDFKTPTRFRFYSGNEAQAVDSFIASAEGQGECPAYRGLAYAVFEDFELADYGNRIPSLSFEVIADEGDVTLGAIVEALAPPGVSANLAMMVGGFVASGQTARSNIIGFAELSPLMARREGDGLHLFDAAPAGPGINEDWLGASATDDPKPRVETSRAAIDKIPSRIALSHADPARDYQPGLQRARREAPHRNEAEIALPVTFAADQALQIAERALSLRWAAREQVRLRLPWRGVAIAPGMDISIPGLNGQWRVTKATLEAMVVALDLERVSATAIPMQSADPGRATAQADLVHGATYLELIDLPPLDDVEATAPLVVAAAAGVSPGWRSAALLSSSDDGGSWQDAGATALPAVIGTALGALGPGDAALEDRRNSIDVQLLHPAMALLNSDAAGLNAGRNLALLGDELIQFGSASLIGPGQYRLQHLRRGLRGTEAALATHVAGDRFILIERETLRPITVAAGSARIRVMGTGVGDIAGAVERSLIAPGQALMPLAPVHVRAQPQGQDTAISWIRRSRAGWAWSDGVDAPLAEEREVYQLEIQVGAALRTLEMDAPFWLYTAADRAADAQSGHSSVTFTVRQIGRHGLSPPASLTFPIT